MSSEFCCLLNNLLLDENKLGKIFYKCKNEYLYSYFDKFGIKCLMGYNNNDFKEGFLIINEIAIICDGEIYNYKELSKLINVNLTTNYSYEIIIHLYILYGLEQTLLYLNGNFVFMLYDFRCIDNCINPKIYLARDPFGIKNIYMLHKKNIPINDDKNIYGFSTNYYFLYKIKENTNNSTIQEIEPATYYSIFLGSKALSNWKIVKNTRYYTPCGLNLSCVNNYIGNGLDLEFLQYLKKSVCNFLFYVENKGIEENKIGINLTFEISSVLLISYLKKIGCNFDAYSIGDVNSETIKSNIQLCEKLGIKHIVFDINKEELNDLSIKFSEFKEKAHKYSFFYLFGKKLKDFGIGYVISYYGGKDICGLNENDNKIVFQNVIEYDNNIRHSVKNICNGDMKIFNMMMKLHGINVFNPFLDKDLINYYLSNSININKIYKNIL